MNEERLWKLLGVLLEMHDCATKRQVRAGRRAYLQAVRLVLAAIDEERIRRS
jgi:hypothetical protein